jgi:hypothetical protein
MLELGRVTAVHPESHSVDVTLVNDRRRLSGVRVLSPTASGNTGFYDLPQCSVDASVGRPAAEPIGEREMFAAIAFFSGIPICVGFMFPNTSQLLFSDRNRKIERHASDVYQTIDGDGNYEFCHPSGTYLRIGETSAHEDLTGKDFDGRWAITKNTGRAPHVHLEVRNGGATVAVIDIDPSGNVSESNAGNLTAGAGGNISATAGGNLSATVGGTASISSSGAMTITAPTITLNGQTIINGALSQGKGAAGGACTMLGPLMVAGDVTAGGKSLEHHTHPDPQGGNTSPPS